MTLDTGTYAAGKCSCTENNPHVNPFGKIRVHHQRIIVHSPENYPSGALGHAAILTKLSTNLGICHSRVQYIRQCIYIVPAHRLSQPYRCRHSYRQLDQPYMENPPMRTDYRWAEQRAIKLNTHLTQWYCAVLRWHEKNTFYYCVATQKVCEGKQRYCLPSQSLHSLHSFANFWVGTQNFARLRKHCVPSKRKNSHISSVPP